METITLSSKYQVVIPKKLRRELGLKPGQKLRIRKTRNGSLEIQTKSALDRLYGSMKGAWGDNSTQYLRELREEANHDRT